MILETAALLPLQPVRTMSSRPTIVLMRNNFFLPVMYTFLTAAWLLKTAC